MKVHKISPNDYEPVYDFREVPIEIEEHDFRTHDPGNRAPFTWTSKDEEGDDVHGGLSKAPYKQQLSKRGKVNRKHTRAAKRMCIDHIHYLLFSWFYAYELRREIQAFVHVIPATRYVLHVHCTLLGADVSSGLSERPRIV